MQRVPWQTVEEWRDVRKKLYSSDAQDLKKGYEVLLMWKARGGYLPAHVECTISIVQVLLQEWSMDKSSHPIYNHIDTLFNEESNLQLSFATALLRFVNHALTCAAQGSSLYAVAQKQNIPDWVINLRHDVAHNSSLPPFTILHSAVLLAKQWLKENYWDVEEPKMNAVIAKPLEKERTRNDGPSLDEVVVMTLKLWEESLAFNEKSAKVRDLTPKTWKLAKKISRQLKVPSLNVFKNRKSVGVFDAFIDAVTSESQRLENQKSCNVSISQFRDIVMNVIREFASKQNTRLAVVKGFLSIDSLNSGQRHQIKKYSPLLKILYNIDSLESLVVHLIDRCIREVDSDHEEDSCAEEWLLALASPLLRSLHRSGHCKRIKCTLDSGAMFMELPVRPPPVLQLSVVEKLVLKNFALFKYLHFAHPPVEESVLKKLEALAKIEESAFATRDNEVTVEENTYTVEDVDMEAEEVKPIGWRLSKYDSETWGRLPLGAFPGQTKVDLEVLEDFTYADPLSEYRESTISSPSGINLTDDGI